MVQTRVQIVHHKEELVVVNMVTLLLKVHSAFLTVGTAIRFRSSQTSSKVNSLFQPIKAIKFITKEA